MRAFAKCWACIVVCVGALYGRFLSNGWMGLDDEVLLRQNTHLGLGTRSWVWGLLDVNFGRRWTPMLWSVANLVGEPSAFRYHVLVFVLALMVSSLCLACYWSVLPPLGAMVGTMAFVFSPMRLEVFAWEMGFVYETVAVFVMLAFLTRRNAWLSCLCLVWALLTYPIAAGPVALGCWYHRKSYASPLLAAFFFWVYHLQMGLRERIGFIPWHLRWDACWQVLPHYALMALVPYMNLPICPAIVFVWLPLGFAVLVWGFVSYPRFAIAWSVLVAPVVLASVTESFWFGARYALLPDLLAFWGLGALVTRLGSRRAVALVVCAVYCLAALNVSDQWMWTNAQTIIDGVVLESDFGGRDVRPMIRAIPRQRRYLRRNASGLLESLEQAKHP